MSTTVILTIILVLAVAGWFVGRQRSKMVAGGDASKLHSRPNYYGSYILTWTILPSCLLLAAWLIVTPFVIQNTITSTLPQDVQQMDPAARGLQLTVVDAVARGLTRLDDEELAGLRDNPDTMRDLMGSKGVAIPGNSAPWMIDAAAVQNDVAATSRTLMTIAVLAVAALGFVLAFLQIKPRLRARNRVESVVLGMLIVASTIAILTTVGIVFSMLSESLRFFDSVPPQNFFFGIDWNPRFTNVDETASTSGFGLIPLLAGTLYIAFVAMLVAVPIGLFAAIYMAEYASNHLRSIVKPLLEVLAGIPTIVYGFFALVTVGPFLRDLSAALAGGSPFIQAQSVLTAGFVMGIMLIPFVSSLSDDVITQVPRSMRDGSLGLGATRSETMRKVILPAALPGVVGALLLTASRAIGETMIVVLAAGVAANLTLNPGEPMTTVTVKIVNQLTGDLEFDTPQTLVAFALGITLFIITLGLNIYALYIVRKYREQYE